MTRIACALVAAALSLLLAYPAQAQRPLTKVPRVLIAGGGDARVQLVHAAVSHWNGIFAGIGSGFRLGPVSQGGNAAGQPGEIVVVLSDGEFVSHVNRLSGGNGAVVMIRNMNGPPTSLPNVMRNVIAHELGHAIGLPHNSNPALLMCGRPAPCRPALFTSQSPHYFPLSGAERSRLLAMYPAGWRGQ
jgi:hypothetical protein